MISSLNINILDKCCIIGENSEKSSVEKALYFPFFLVLSYIKNWSRQDGHVQGGMAMD